jgi:hypothetical protein
MLPGAQFRPKRRMRADGSVYYDRYHLCLEHEREHERQRKRAAYRRVLPDGPGRRGVSRLPIDPVERAQVDARRAAFAAAIRRYVADIWEQTPAWVVARDRTPDQVDARSLVVAILYREHGWPITAAAAAIARDHSTALYTLGPRLQQPEFLDLLNDYRHWRAQRKAARAARQQRAS